MKRFFFTFLFLVGLIPLVNSQNCSASFTYSSSPGNILQYGFFNSSSTAIVNFDSINYLWSFGDGNVSSQEDPSHLYAQPGNYLVCLTMFVVNNQGTNLCVDSICTTVNISFGTTCNPSFQWAPNAANPMDILFQNSSTVQNIYPGDSVQITWDFGDGNFSGGSLGASVNHIYANFGTYTACLNIFVFDSSGSVTCTNSYCDSVVINFIPVSCNSDFSWTLDSLSPGTVSFLDSSSFSPLGLGYSDSIVWDLGDGSSDTGNSFIHNYASSGTYTVCQYYYVVQQGNIVCSDTTCKQVRVRGPIDFCRLEYIIDTVNSYAGVVYVWNLGDSLNPNTSNTYFWDFGDGNTSNQAYPSHQYLTTGNYYLCLTINSINSFGDTCIVTYCDSLQVNPNGTLGKFRSGFVLNVLNPLTIGIREFEKAGMDIFPNPANDQIQVLTPGDFDEVLDWKIFSLSGKIMLTGKINQEAERLEKIDVSSLRNGIYLISINGKNSVFNSKLKIRRW